MNREIKEWYRKAILFYLRYKDTRYYSISLYGGIIAISLLLAFLVVIPEIRNWFSVQEEVQASRTRISIMKDNIQLLQAMNRTQLDNDFTTASMAVPPTRDISLLLSAINFSAVQSGVGMEDFSFQGGEVSSRSTVNIPKQSENNSTITFTITGSLAQMSAFLNELQQKTPLLTLNSIAAQFKETDSARITISYFFRAFPLVTQDDSSQISALSSDNKLLLEKLRNWKVPVEPAVDVTTGSESASPL
jgi:hypothetical protein